jgi:hypothetical protein
MIGCLHINLDLGTNIPQYNKHIAIHTIHQALEDKQYCTSILLDVSQAFNKVWQAGLLFKVKNVFPIPYFRLLKSYLSDREFQTRLNEEESS